MAQDTLIILCKNLNHAIMAASNIERQHDLNRLFIFLGKKPTDKELSWMTGADSSFCLERVIEWGDSPELIGIRAGLMFATGWDLLFCWADNCPSSKDVDWVRKKLNTEGKAKLSNIWGLSRDHYILHGLGEDAQQFSTAEPKQNQITTGLNIADALDGKPVDLPTVILTLQEIVALSPLAVHASAIKSGNDVIESIINAADYIDDVAPLSIIIGENCDENIVLALRQKIANHGVLIQVSKSLPEYTFKPYRTILAEDGTKIALYGK